MSLFNRFLINAIFIYAAKIIEGILQLGLVAFILSEVEREYYAAALLIMSIQATIDLARGGMQKATLKYIAEYKAKRDITGVNGVLSSSSAMQGVIGLIGLGGCIVIAPFGTVLFSLPTYMQNEAQWATILLGVGISVSFAISPWQNSVAAQERYDLLSIATLIGKFFRAILVVILLLLNAPPLMSLVFATVAGGILERLICIAFVKKISPELQFSFKNFDFEYVKVMLGFSLFDFFHTLSGILYSQGTLYLAAHLISLNAVAALGIIGNITSLIGMVTNQIAQMLVPVASRLNAQGDGTRLKEMVTRGTTITVFAGGLVMAGIIPWMQSLLIVWLGPTYSNLATPAIIMITATYLVNSLTCIHNSLGGIGRVAVDGISSTICTILGLIVGSILLYSTDLALLGLTLGLLFARVSRFIFINWYGGRLFQIRTIEFLWRGYLRTYLLLLAVSFAGMSTGLPVSSWYFLALFASVTSGLYLTIGFFWIIDATDRSRFVSALFEGVTYLRIRMLGPQI